MWRILERRAHRDRDPLPSRRLVIAGSDRDWRPLLGQALDDHPRHLADVAEHLLARGTPGGGTVGHQRGAVGVPHLVGRLDDDREGVGAGCAAHGASIASLPATEAVRAGFPKFACLPHEEVIEAVSLWYTHSM